jgi:hypothetical protein
MSTARSEPCSSAAPLTQGGRPRWRERRRAKGGKASAILTRWLRLLRRDHTVHTPLSQLQPFALSRPAPARSGWGWGRQQSWLQLTRLFQPQRRLPQEECYVLGAPPGWLSRSFWWPWGHSCPACSRGQADQGCGRLWRPRPLAQGLPQHGYSQGEWSEKDRRPLMPRLRWRGWCCGSRGLSNRVVRLSASQHASREHVGKAKGTDLGKHKTYGAERFQQGGF